MIDKSHTERAHATLSASGSKRWLKCAPSVNLEKKLPDKKSEYADEGTAAHEVAEIRGRELAFNLGYSKDSIDVTKEFTKLFDSDLGVFYSTEMENYIKMYTDYIFLTLAKYQNALLKFETQVNFSKYTSDKEGEGFGTLDNQIMSADTLHIIDLKYGAGVKVFASDESETLNGLPLGNSQLMLYALGALESNEAKMLYSGITKVVLTIVQPRLDFIDEFEMSVDTLKLWGDTVCKPKAEKALRGDGDLVTGDHCRFCKVKAICKKRADDALNVAKFEFKDPNLLSIEEIPEILKLKDSVISWLSDVSSFALQSAIDGAKFSGFKLVKANTNAKIINELGLVTELRLHGVKESDIYKTSIKSLTELKKLVKGKKDVDALILPYTGKSDGAPILVEDSDKRPAIDKINEAKNDFKTKQN